MKKFSNRGPRWPRGIIGTLLTKRRILSFLVVAAGLVPGAKALGGAINLSDAPPPDSVSVAAGMSPGSGDVIDLGTAVPDGGSTLLLLGLTFASLGLFGLGRCSRLAKRWNWPRPRFGASHKISAP